MGDLLASLKFQSHYVVFSMSDYFGLNLRELSQKQWPPTIFVEPYEDEQHVPVIHTMIYHMTSL